MIRRFFNKAHNTLRGGIKKANAIRAKAEKYVPVANKVINKAIDMRYPGNSVKVNLSKPSTIPDSIKDKARGVVNNFTPRAKDVITNVARGVNQYKPNYVSNAVLKTM